MRIPIRIPVRYRYKHYKYSPKLTQRSKAIGYFTGGPMFLVYAIFWVCLLNAVLSSVGFGEDAAIMVSLFSVVLLIPILNKIQAKAFRKLDEQYIREIQALQDTDPQKYMQILTELRGGK